MSTPAAQEDVIVVENLHRRFTGHRVHDQLTDETAFASGESHQLTQHGAQARERRAVFHQPGLQTIKQGRVPAFDQLAQITFAIAEVIDEAAGIDPRLLAQAAHGEPAQAGLPRHGEPAVQQQLAGGMK